MRKLLIAIAAMLTLTATSLAEVKVAEAPPKHSALFAHGMAVGQSTPLTYQTHIQPTQPGGLFLPPIPSP